MRVRTLHKDQNGSHVLPVLVVIATIGVVLYVGYTVFTKNKQTNGPDSGQASQVLLS